MLSANHARMMEPRLNNPQVVIPFPQEELTQMTPRKILYVTDFSANSEPAFQLAREYARVFGARLEILHVIHVSSAWDQELAQTSYYEEALKIMEEMARDSLKALRDRCPKAIPEVKCYSVRGIATREIVRFANENSVDLIVMGTHGRTGLSHLILGSVAENVVRTASRPVLIVRSPVASVQASEEPYSYPVP
jgi:nucleotide-binding universal stress UspA family protein